MSTLYILHSSTSIIAHGYCYTKPNKSLYETTQTNTDHGNTVKMEVIRVLKDCSSLIHT